MNILDKILKEKEFEVENLKKSFPLEQLQEGIFKKKYDIRSLYDALNNNNTKIIAEIKKASPSKGIIQENFQPLKIALEYFNGGASAISILTDEKFFQGKIDYITAVRSVVNIPILRKDFIVDDYQIYQSKFYGADAILLIGKALTLKKLTSLCEISQKLNLDVIYEVHDNDDFKKGIEAGVKIFGVNNRNLETFDVDNANVLNFINKIPNNSILISESGISSKDDLDMLVNLGVKNFLIGEYLMVSPLSKNTFSKAIHQSGGVPLIYPTLKTDAQNQAIKFEKYFFNEYTGNVLNELKKIDSNEILKAVEEVYSEEFFDFVVDGITIIEPLMESFKKGNIHSVDLIIGANNDEWSLYHDDNVDVNKWLYEETTPEQKEKLLNL